MVSRDGVGYWLMRWPLLCVFLLARFALADAVLGKRGNIAICEESSALNAAKIQMKDVRSSTGALKHRRSPGCGIVEKSGRDISSA